MLDDDEVRLGESILIQHLFYLFIEGSLISKRGNNSLLLARLFVGNGGSKILIQRGI